ncbi:MAG: nickel-responsive transcriptional regulator NikR [Archaeoglobaceae archaeon]|nr:nickel-responsive transcriptional regulator NikR [Archaeoglobaceae archaeon]MCX8151589.1 nickel-responsive transcriptional regulator NikR [Archaeoglobaceae archaeon]MDW8013133.1 nickel-responsive transcriptional regulator NikR [Archaeoglobaceae archaeon]
MEEEIARIGVSLPKNLLDEFDKVIANRGYSSRSEAIRDAIRAYLLEYKWLEKEEGQVVGAISLVYDHSVKGISDAITDVQHEFNVYISASVHLHLDAEQCLEIVLVRGDIAQIKKLIDKLISLRGVLNVKFMTAFRL